MQSTGIFVDYELPQYIIRWHLENDAYGYSKSSCFTFRTEISY